MDTNPQSGGPPAGGGVAFLIAQIGAHATDRFANAVAALELTPPQSGLLRLLAATPGRSQRELADALGMPPSRFVPFADGLEQRGLIERRRNPDDRRLHAVFLTPQGQELLGRLRVVAIAHEQAICAALDAEERTRLQGMLARIAAQQGLAMGVHPGYQTVRPT